MHRHQVPSTWISLTSTALRSTFVGLGHKQLVKIAALGASSTIILIALIGLIATHKNVTVVVDGQSQQVSTWNNQSYQIIDQAGIQLNPADSVTLANNKNQATKTVTNGATITVNSARELGIVGTTAQTRIWSAAPTLSAVAASIAGDKKGENKVKVAALRSFGAIPLSATSKHAQILADGKAITVTIDAGQDISAILTAAKLSAGPLDKVNISLAKDGSPQINLIRVTRSVKIDQIKTPRPVQEEKDDSLYSDQRIVVKAGSDGLVEKRTFSVSENGKTIYSAVESESIKSTPTKETVRVGTKTRPANPSGGRYVSDDAMWNKIIQCESGGNPRAVNPAGYYGLYQFSLPTWRSVGGSGNPIDASPAEQTMRAKMLQARSGWGQWSCAY